VVEREPSQRGFGLEERWLSKNASRVKKKRTWCRVRGESGKGLHRANRGEESFGIEKESAIIWWANSRRKALLGKKACFGEVFQYSPVHLWEGIKGKIGTTM